MKNHSKKIVELLPWTFQEVHLKKDPGLFPKYISKEYDIPYEIAFLNLEPENSYSKENIDSYGILKKIEATHSGKSESIKSNILPNPFDDFKTWKILIKPICKYLWKNRKSNTHYILFHNNDNTVAFAFLIKLFNSKAKIWLKMDANPSNLSRKLDDLYRKNGLKQKLKSALYRKVYRNIDMLSTETEETFAMLQNNSFFSKLNIQKIPNGLEALPNTNNLPKENCIISVARFGSHQKNTELLLEALSRTNLKDWKVYCIGPIEKAEQDFESKIKLFFEVHPNLVDKIIFLGNITDKEQLNSYYKKAKVFVLPSRYEGFAIAPLEAASYQDYLILTDVGAARDLIPNETFGYILPESSQDKQNEDIIKEKLAQKLTSIINGTEKIDSNLKARDSFIQQFSMENIAKRNCFKEWIL